MIIALTDDPNVTATGRVREVAPQADPATRTFKVRVASPIRRGHAARLHRDRPHGGRRATACRFPASALTRQGRQPAVWVVDPDEQTVALQRRRPALRPGTVVISQGLEAGDIVVTAGVQALRPGQKVRLLGGAVMIGFNLSEWALRHRSLIVF